LDTKLKDRRLGQMVGGIPRVQSDLNLLTNDDVPGANYITSKKNGWMGTSSDVGDVTYGLFCLQ
jgi:hypothetical protein